MTSIIYVGLDVHTSNFTACCYSVSDDRAFAVVQMKPDYREILEYLNRINSQHGGKCKFVCGYEAGCLGYSLYHQLTRKGVDCVILAPSTMPITPGKKIKTDKRDAEKIARCLAYHSYSPVYIPDEEDNAVKEYIRMRDDGVASLKRVKQQIIALYTRNGKMFDGKNYWTKKHLDWLQGLEFAHPVLKETLQEYLVRYYTLSEKVDIYNKRIEELSHTQRYEEPVKKLCCLNGIGVHTAMCALVEVGDFHRFEKASNFASYLGLVPGEDSSSDRQRRTGITKAGNAHLRRLLIESAQCLSRGRIGQKSKALKARQKEVDPQIAAYSDRANERLKRKFHRIALHSKHNIAKTAAARELACFMWGMMNGNLA